MTAFFSRLHAMLPTMDRCIESSQSGPLAAASTFSSAARPRPTADRALTSYDWPSVGAGIALAGGAYPMVLMAFGAVIAVFVALVACLTGQLSGLELLQGLVMTMAFLATSPIAATFGLIWAGLVSIVALPIVYAVSWTLDLRGNFVRFGAFCGGLVGFLAVLPLALLFLIESQGGFDSAIVLIIGPALTTVMGQIGGAWSANTPSHAEMLARARASEAAPLRGDSAEGDAEVAVVVASRPFQFSIRQALWTVVWLSLLLSVVRLTGLPFGQLLFLLGAWLVYQAVTLWIGTVLARRLGPWWARRKSRST